MFRRVAFLLQKCCKSCCSFFEFCNKSQNDPVLHFVEKLQQRANQNCNKSATQSSGNISTLYANLLPCCNFAEFFPKISRSVRFSPESGGYRLDKFEQSTWKIFDKMRPSLVGATGLRPVFPVLMPVFSGIGPVKTWLRRVAVCFAKPIINQYICGIQRPKILPRKNRWKRPPKT